MILDSSQYWDKIASAFPFQVELKKQSMLDRKRLDMRKFILLIITVFIPLYPMVFAQDSDPAQLELGQTLVVSGLNFTIAYPTGWVHDVSQRIAVAETADDLAAITDDDNATLPSGRSLTLSSAPKTAITNALSNDDPTLDEVTALVVRSIQVDTNFDLSIMGRRASSFTGLNATGRWGIGSVWEMDDFYLFLGMGTDEENISDEFIALYESVAASMSQFNDEPIILGDEPIVLESLDVSMSYPRDWMTSEVNDAPFTGMGFFVDADALARWNEGGILEQPTLFVLSVSSEDLPDVMDLSAREAAESLTEEMEEVTLEGEFLIGDLQGFGFSGLQDGVYIYFVAMASTENNWTIYSLRAGDRETGEAAIPIFIRMLQSVTTAGA